MVLQARPGGALNRPSAGKAAALGGAAIATAAIAIGVAQIELSGKPQPDIWSNSWLLVALSLAFVGLMIAVVFFVIDIFAREPRRSENRQSLKNITRRCNKLARDIYNFEDERGLSHDSTPKYDQQTVHLCHLKFGQEELELASDVQAMGVPQDDLKQLYDQQQTTDQIHATANFIKYVPGIVARRTR